MHEISTKLENLTKRAEEILEDRKAPTKTKKEEILNSIDLLKQEIYSNIPFMAEQFNKQMDKTVSEAKGEVEAFVDSKVHSLGIEGLKKEMLLLNENNI